MKQKNYRKTLKGKKFLKKVSKLIVAFSIVSVTLTTVFFISNVDCVTKAYAERISEKEMQVEAFVTTLSFEAEVPKRRNTYGKLRLFQTIQE